MNFSLAPIKAPLISLYCCFSISFYSCGSLIVDLAVKFTSIVTEDWVLSVFRNATKSGTLGGFSVNASSIVGIVPVIQSTTKRPITTPTPEPDGMSPLHSSLKKKKPRLFIKSVLVHTNINDSTHCLWKKRGRACFHSQTSEADQEHEQT